MWDQQKKWYYYTKSQRRGFVYFVLLLCSVQVAFLFLELRTFSEVALSEIIDQEKLALYKAEVYQLQQLQQAKKDTVYPFNPNYISDFRGFQLGMSLAEIDRLHQYRARGKFINTIEQFQKITGVSDEWILRYAPSFKFPSRPRFTNKKVSVASKVSQLPLAKLCINLATSDELQKIYGVGPAYAQRILKDRDRLGGYQDIRQVDFVYNLPDTVLVQLKEYFEVQVKPEIQRLNIDEATIDELKSLPYMNYYSAREIVKYRSMHGGIKSRNELAKIDKFPLEKIDIISLYLIFD